MGSLLFELGKDQPRISESALLDGVLKRELLHIGSRQTSRCGDSLSIFGGAVSLPIPERAIEQTTQLDQRVIAFLVLVPRLRGV